MIDEEQEPPFQSDSALEYSDKIEDMFAYKPDRRHKDEYQKWKDEINRLISECNRLANFKQYNLIK